jgi:regulation of enolase protein 1 (concanavalin A-like superfamily)
MTKDRFALLTLCFTGLVAAQLFAAEPELRIEGIPDSLSVVNSPIAVRVEPEGRLFIQAPGKTNLFNSPIGSYSVQTAPMVLFTPAGDFVLKARVEGQLKNVYDVAALVIYQDDATWAKLCYENSVTKKPTIVSVVTRGVSDDCNSQTLSTDHTYLAIIRKGNGFAFHSSIDGQTWTMVRCFNLNITGKIRIGFAVHAHRDEPFAATFSEITYTDKIPANLTNLNPAAK